MILSVDWFYKTYVKLNGTNNIWVAFSGGIDSRVLLELCLQLTQVYPKYKLQAVHINHGLHQNASTWTKHCQEVCANLQIPIQIFNVNIKKNGESLEALARQARRNIWQELLPKDGSLLLAHHQQDQAETILQRLFRGSGPTGLCGMAKYCEFGKGILLRPLLDITKSQIINFAKTNDLTWIDDDSNQDHKFDRNFIRHNILPELTNRWPAVINNIVRSGELCRENILTIDLVIQDLLPTLEGSSPKTLSIPKLLNLSTAHYNEVIRTWLNNLQYPLPSRSQLARIKQEVILAKSSSNPVLNFSTYKIRRYRDDLYATDHPSPGCCAASLHIINWNGESTIKLPQIGTLNITKVLGQGIKIPNNSNSITICIGSKGRKAKKIFQKHAIPPWKRFLYPLIFYNNKLISISGLWIKPGFTTSNLEFGIICKLTE